MRLAFVTLHVGADTFRPVRAERVLDHEMHSEFVAVPDGTARAVAATRRAGGRVVAVGTTAVRSLESSVAAGGLAHPPAQRRASPPVHRFRRGHSPEGPEGRTG